MSRTHFAVSGHDVACGRTYARTMVYTQSRPNFASAVKEGRACARCVARMAERDDAEFNAAHDSAMAETERATRVTSNMLAERFLRAAVACAEETEVLASYRRGEDNRMVIELRGKHLSDVVEVYRATANIITSVSGDPLRAEITLFDTADGHTMRLSRFANHGRM